MTAPNILGLTTVNGKTVGAAITTSMVAALTNAASSNKVYKVNSVYVSNIDGSNPVDVTVTFYNGTMDYSLADNQTVTNGSTLVVVSKDAPIYLEETHAIRVQASANSDAEVVISYEDMS